MIILIAAGLYLNTTYIVSLEDKGSACVIGTLRPESPWERVEGVGACQDIADRINGKKPPP